MVQYSAHFIKKHNLSTPRRKVGSLEPTPVKFEDGLQMKYPELP